MTTVTGTPLNVAQSHGSKNSGIDGHVTDNKKLTVFLDNPPRVVGAIENPSDSVLLILSWILEELGPTMFPKDAIKMGIGSVDFNDDHVARLSK